MGDKCQSRHKFVPEIPESMRTAQLWHLRYQDKYLQPSVATVLWERAANVAPVLVRCARLAAGCRLWICRTPVLRD